MKFNAKTLEDFYFEWTKYEAVYKLGEKPKSFKHTKFYDYVICAVSANVQENFEIYIQNKENFSKA